MKVDLAKFSAYSLNIRANIAISKDSSAFFHQTEQSFLREPMAITETYSVEGRFYDTLLVASKLKEENKVFLYANYSNSASSEVSKEPTSETFWKTLSNIQEAQNFVVEALFHYPRSKYTSIFGFPLPVPGTPGSASLFDEIRGFRLIKLEKNQKIYDVSIEEVEDQPVLVMVRFGYVGTPGPSVPESIIEAASRISSKFVSQVGEKSNVGI